MEGFHLSALIIVVVLGVVAIIMDWQRPFAVLSVLH